MGPHRWATAFWWGTLRRMRYIKYMAPLLLLAVTGLSAADDSRLIREEAVDAAKREQAELKSRLRDLEERLETARRLERKQDELLEALRRKLDEHGDGDERQD